MNISPENITKLKLNEIFVFGSNSAGKHGKGAALTALRKFGAKYGQGEGLVGQTYGIPTKNKQIQTLPLAAIEKYVDEFINFAKTRPDLTFLVTEIGCGLAGYKPKDIAPMFFKETLPPNVYLPESFWKYESRLHSS